MDPKTQEALTVALTAIAANQQAQAEFMQLWTKCMKELEPLVKMAVLLAERQIIEDLKR